jgi:hypothetical protein
MTYDMMWATQIASYLAVLELCNAHTVTVTDKKVFELHVICLHNFNPEPAPVADDPTRSPALVKAMQESTC